MTGRLTSILHEEEVPVGYKTASVTRFQVAEPSGAEESGIYTDAEKNEDLSGPEISRGPCEESQDRLDIGAW